uniref:WGS project CAEQ00000000 data, annotated contig 591 n=1 Tax=Trypanosoma congolense (strain IL3000) TaxID=1068625 RepID=F9WH42_TRYCI|nr:unnamed protein product [Trypanosoma congolense IL3000]
MNGMCHVLTHRHRTNRLPASLLYNNLTLIDECAVIVYASHNNCAVVDLSNQKVHLLPLEAVDEPIVHCTATFLPCGGANEGPEILILLTTQSSTQLWTPTRPLSVVSHGGVHGNGSCGAIAPASTRGVNIILGTSKGVVMFAAYHAKRPATKQRENSSENTSPIFRVVSAVKGHKDNAVTAVQVNRYYNSPLLAVSGDVAGQLLLWSHDQQPFVSISTLECVTAVQIVSGGDYVVAANGAGRLIMLDSHTGSTCIDVCAHSRWIYTLSYHPMCNVLLSGAEDGYVILWLTPAHGSQNVTEFRPTAAHHMQNALPTGAAVSADASQVFITVYDMDGVHQYKITNSKKGP